MFELGQRIRHLEVNVDAEGGGKPFLNPLVEGFGVGERAVKQEEMEGQKRFLRFLVFGCADQGFEHAGVVVDVLEVDVVGQFLLIAQLAVRIVRVLTKQESAGANEDRERRNGFGELVLRNGALNPKLGAGHDKQDGKRRHKVEDDRHASQKCWAAQQQHVLLLHDDANVGHQHRQLGP